MMGFAAKLVLRAICGRFRKSAVTFLGVALAVASLVTLEAIMEGVSDTMVRNSVALHHGHVLASWPPGGGGRILLFSADGEVLRRSRLEGTCLVGSRQVSTVLYGIIPEAEARRTVIASRVVRGSYLPSPGGILLGDAAATALGVEPGDEIEFWRKGAPSLRLRVCGVFRTGIDSMDRQVAFARFEDVSQGAGEVAVFLSRPEDARATADAWEASLPSGATVRTWDESLAELTQLIALNHVSMNVVLALALLILAFGVSNTVFISVSERTREFGVLKAMGFTPCGVTLLVLVEVLVLVSAAGLAGVAVGAGVSEVWSQAGGLDLSAWTSENRHFIGSGVVYPHVTLRSLALPLLVAVVCGLLAGGIPARRVGRIRVVEALRAV